MNSTQMSYADMAWVGIKPTSDKTAGNNTSNKATTSKITFTKPIVSKTTSFTTASDQHNTSATLKKAANSKPTTNKNITSGEEEVTIPPNPDKTSRFRPIFPDINTTTPEFAAKKVAYYANLQPESDDCDVDLDYLTEASAIAELERRAALRPNKEAIEHEVDRKLVQYGFTEVGIGRREVAKLKAYVEPSAVEMQGVVAAEAPPKKAAKRVMSYAEMAKCGLRMGEKE